MHAASRHRTPSLASLTKSLYRGYLKTAGRVRLTNGGDRIIVFSPFLKIL